MNPISVTTFYRFIGNEIRRARSLKGLSQTQLFNETGINRETISRIECGSRNIKVIHLYILCDVLDVSIDNLFKKYGEINEN